MTGSELMVRSEQVVALRLFDLADEIDLKRGDRRATQGSIWSSPLTVVLCHPSVVFVRRDGRPSVIFPRQCPTRSRVRAHHSPLLPGGAAGAAFDPGRRPTR